MEIVHVYIKREEINARLPKFIEKLTPVLIFCNVFIYSWQLFTVIAWIIQWNQFLIHQIYWLVFGVEILGIGLFTSIYGGRLAYFFKKANTLQHKAVKVSFHL
jgi:hypothetical protein